MNTLFSNSFYFVALLFLSNNVYYSHQQQQQQEQEGVMVTQHNNKETVARLNCDDNSSKCELFTIQENGNEKRVDAKVIHCVGVDCVVASLGQIYICRRLNRNTATCEKQSLSLLERLFNNDADIDSEFYDIDDEMHKKRALPFETLNYGRRKRMLPFETLNYGKRNFNLNNKYESRRSGLPFETLNYGKRMLPFETLNYGKRAAAAASYFSKSLPFEGYILGRETNEDDKRK